MKVFLVRFHVNHNQMNAKGSALPSVFHLFLFFFGTIGQNMSNPSNPRNAGSATEMLNAQLTL